jgi:hypothetical protein
MQHTLRNFDWAEIEPDPRRLWAPKDLLARLEGFDLVIDATGSAPFAELLSRVAESAHIPLVSVAIYRGGRIIRARRRSGKDTPFAKRRRHWRYPPIPPGDPAEDYAGVEIGCTAPIHNAPPSAVMHAAVIATDMALDILTGRFDLPDEHLEIRQPIEAPLNHRGRARPTLPALQLTDAAAATIRAVAAAAQPNETGGILVGILDTYGAPVVATAIEIRAIRPSTRGYEIEPTTTSAALAQARKEDARIGYLGEWHSHPTDQSASTTDRTTMRALARHPDTGTPALIVARPTQVGFELDAYLADGDILEPVPIIAVGPIPEVD